MEKYIWMPLIHKNKISTEILHFLTKYWNLILQLTKIYIVGCLSLSVMHVTNASEDGAGTASV